MERSFALELSTLERVLSPFLLLIYGLGPKQIAWNGNPLIDIIRKGIRHHSK